MASVLDGGRACVIGCFGEFASADAGATHAFDLIDQLASAAAGVTAVPPSTLVTGRPGTTPESGGASLGTETPAVGGGEGGPTPAVPAGGASSPGADLRAGLPDRTSERTTGPGLALFQDTRPPVAEEVVAEAMRVPFGPAAEIALAAALPGSPQRRVALAALADVAAVDPTFPSVLETQAPEALRLAAALFPEVAFAPSAPGHPERIAVVVAAQPDTALTVDTAPPLGIQLAMASPTPWQAPAVSAPSADTLTARPGKTQIGLAPAVAPTPTVEPATGGSQPSIAATASSVGAMRIAAVVPKVAEKRWIVTAPPLPEGHAASVGSTPSRPVENATAVALRPQVTRPAVAIRLARALPGGSPPSAVMTSSSSPDEQPSAVASPERPHTEVTRPLGQPLEGTPASASLPVSSSLPGGVSATPSGATERPRASTARPAPATLSAAPATSGPTAGWAVDAGTNALRVPAPPGWSLSVKTADGPGGPAIVVQGQCVTEPSERFVWVQPGLPGYREFTQLLQAMGYREWQPYKDAVGNRTLTLVARRTPARFLEQIVLPDSPAKLTTWQILDAQASSTAADLVGGADGLVAHLLASGEGGAAEGWFSVATGTPDGQPSYIWVGAWLGATAKPGDTRAVDALAQAILGAQVLDTPARGTLERAVAAAQAAVRDLKSGAGRGRTR
jgi:hypothetical protein